MTKTNYVNAKSIHYTAIDDWYLTSPEAVADRYQAETGCTDEVRAIYEEGCEEAKTVVTWGFLIGCVAVLVVPAKALFKLGKKWGSFRKK